MISKFNKNSNIFQCSVLSSDFGLRPSKHPGDSKNNVFHWLPWKYFPRDFCNQLPGNA
jgi:hypothetical protein